jgi:hypothetical protein
MPPKREPAAAVEPQDDIARAIKALGDPETFIGEAENLTTPLLNELRELRDIVQQIRLVVEFQSDKRPYTKLSKVHELALQGVRLCLRR